MDPLAKLFARYAARGDVDALGEVFDRTAGRLLRLAMHLAATAEDAEDLLQATFVLAMKKAAGFDRAQPLLPWLSGILAGEARNLARKNQRRRPPQLTGELPELAADDGGPVAAAERRELVAQLREHVEALPGEQRQALLLQLQHGLSPTAIAEVLDVPPGTVRMRLHRGLQALRKLLPSGLAVWLFGALPTRGLAAVRGAVMREAGALRTTVAGGAAVAAGIVSMKYAVGAVAAVLAAVLCWWSVAPPEPAPVRPEAHDCARVTSAEPAADAAGAPAVERTSASASGADERRDDTGSLRVRAVTRHDGAPLRDVVLRISPGEQSLPLHDPANRLLRTDDDGFARFDALPPGPWHVAATGFDAFAAPATIAAGSATELALALPANVVRGIVVDENGAAVADAAIRVGQPQWTTPWEAASIAGRLDAMVRVAVRSAADGTFVCAAGETEAFAAAAHPGFRSSRVQPTNAPGVDSLRFVMLPRATSLAGVVLDAQRRPIAGALVAARVFVAVERAPDGTWCSAPLAEFARTDAAGRFQLAALVPGRTTLDAAAEGHGHERVFATTTAGATTDDVEIVLAPAIQITGTVRSADGSPLRDVTVEASRSVPGTRLPGTRPSSPVQSDGRFSFAQLPAPPFDLAVRGHASGALLVHTVAPTDERSLHVELVLPARPTLRGRVVDDGDHPLAQWVVVVRDDASKYEAWTTTDDRGEFAVQHVVGERVRVSTWWPLAPSERTEITDVSPLPGDVVLRVPADRQPRASVSGRLVDHTGQPIAGATVLIATEIAVRHEAVTGSDGAFCIRGIAAGTYDMALKRAEHAPRRLRTVTLAATDAQTLGDVCVLPTATLCVELVRTDGTPWRGWVPGVYLQPPGSNERGWLPRTGDHACEGPVEPGPVRIEVTDPDLIAQPQDVELLPGERRVVRIAIAVGRSVSLMFAGDGGHTTVKIDPNERLHVEVADGSGAIVLREEVRRSPDGDGSWTLDHTFPFGEYAVTARTDSNRRYRGSFVAADTMPERGITMQRLP